MHSSWDAETDAGTRAESGPMMRFAFRGCSKVSASLLPITMGLFIHQ